ncbi:CRP-like cAMP-binding protein [Flavobacterium sp. 90]|uniref:Crp/Fnr family transcriptional regulator n=1 Tax=unclassified Flavobacterium TaxID=196869 RepID=UPI000EADDAA0|nr:MULTISPECIES: Crp/Fnr family transcriptional regulator [unclassified Flavobacterium]RKR08938.1 CRP-like cAMP-binding protein [Flavobacterium sp. 81]TCK52726.1 CRP-like cAMP-binding protein [Flavobacterium sp. 90]
MNPLIKKFKQYGPVPPEIENLLATKIKCKTHKKGDFFLKPGQLISSLFILETGLVRSFYIKDEREINSWFGFENIILGSILPLFYNIPSAENIQFLEESTLYYIQSSDLNKIYQKSNEMNTIGRLMAEEYCKILEDRIMSLQTQSAEERYNSLLEYQPDAVQRISLGHIASYLGIKQETLSRIRKK